MKTSTTLAAAAALLALAACSQSRPAGNATNATTAAAAMAQAGPPGEPVVPGSIGKTEAPAGTYAIDPAHSTLVFRLSHLGFSKYTGGFAKLDGQLQFDPAHPEGMEVTTTIDAKSLTQPSPPPGFHDTLLGKD